LPRPIVIFSTWLLLFLAAACGQKQSAAPYLSDRGELLRGAFAALAADDSENAQHYLERLAILSDDDNFAQLCLAQEVRRQAMTQLNRSLIGGDPAKVDEVIQEQIKFHGAKSGLENLRTLPAALQRLAQANSRMPWTSSSQATSDLDGLAIYEAPLRNLPSYRQWKEAALRQQESLRIQDQTERGVALLLKADAEIAAGFSWRSRFLPMENPQVVGANLAVVATAIAADATAEKALLKAASLPDPQRRLAGEILGWCFGRPDFVIANSPAATTCGTLLETEGLLIRGRMQEARLRLLAMAAGETLASAHRQRLLQAAGLDSNDVGAQCWKTPVPSVPDLLNRAILWQERRR
jgi:hypothetical protein